MSEKTPKTTGAGLWARCKRACAVLAAREPVAEPDGIVIAATGVRGLEKEISFADLSKKAERLLRALNETPADDDLRELIPWLHLVIVAGDDLVSDKASVVIGNTLLQNLDDISLQLDARTQSSAVGAAQDQWREDAQRLLRFMRTEGSELVVGIRLGYEGVSQQMGKMHDAAKLGSITKVGESFSEAGTNARLAMYLWLVGLVTSVGAAIFLLLLGPRENSSDSVKVLNKLPGDWSFEWNAVQAFTVALILLSLATFCAKGAVRSQRYLMGARHREAVAETLVRLVGSVPDLDVQSALLGSVIVDLLSTDPGIDESKGGGDVSVGTRNLVATAISSAVEGAVGSRGAVR